MLNSVAGGCVLVGWPLVCRATKRAKTEGALILVTFFLELFAAARGLIVVFTIQTNPTNREASALPACRLNLRNFQQTQCRDPRRRQPRPICIRIEPFLELAGRTAYNDDYDDEHLSHPIIIFMDLIAADE